MFWLLMLVLIFIIPFPIKLKVSYENKKFSLYIYNLNLLKKSKKNNGIHKKQRKTKKDKPKLDLSLDYIKEISDKLSDIKFKPRLKFKFNLIYGLDDAAETAIFYGVISSWSYIFMNVLSKFFNIASYKIDIKPEMNEFILKMGIESIIFISFVKVIYISIIFYIHMRNYNNFKLNNIKH